MWHQIKEYIKFLSRSTNEHGIHSPFVYQLVTKCLYDKKKHPEYKTIAAYRKAFLNSQETITITDFGQGSRVFNSNQRKIASIAKNAGITAKRQRLLFRLTHYLKPNTILELGTSLGLGTVALALANPKNLVTTIEGCPETAKQAEVAFKTFNIKNIKLQQLTFEDYFTENKRIEQHFVYIDGNHNKQNTLKYFNILLKNVSNDTILIFDDIYWSPQMTEAWNEIKSHPAVTVSIDTFQWGLVFFRKEQLKQHFTIRV